MKVYCYRCGQPEEVEPTIVSVFVQNSESIRITFAEAIVAHTCPQKVQDRIPGLL